MKNVLRIAASVIFLTLVACNNDSDQAIVETDAGNITKEELYQELKKLYGDSVIQQLVEIKLLEDKYEITDKELEEEFEYMREPFDSDEQFLMVLQQNGYESESDFKDSLRIHMLQMKAATEGIEVTEDKLKAFYEEHRERFGEAEASHILVDSEELANEIIQKLNDGAKFEDMVTEYSTDTGSISQGGSVGTVTIHSQLVPEFINATLKLEEGEISEPVQSTYGFHIIKVTKRNDKTLENSYDEIKRAYLEQNSKSVEEVRKMLLKDANVKVNDDQFKDLFIVTEDEEKEEDVEDDASDTSDNEESNESDDED